MSSTPLLEGLHVVDLASFIAGPAAATVLGDFGADVVKVEPPHMGDAYRSLSRIPPNPQVEGVNYPWQLDNRNKRSIALNLKSPSARPVLESLVRWADVLVTNFPPRTREKLGLEYDALAPLNPRLIYADVTGFGEEGPDAHLPGFDVTAYWARSGLMDLTRQRDVAPATNAFGSGDHSTAITLFAGIMTALYRREKTGQGARVTASLLAEGAWAASMWLQAVLVGAKPPRPIDRSDPPNALVNMYRTADDRWIVLGFANEDKQVPPFLKAIGHPEAAENPRYADTPSRRAHAAEIVGLLDKTFATRSLTEWRELLDAAGLTYGVVQTLEECAQDPQLLANQVFVPIDDGSDDPHLTVDSPVRLDQEQKVRPGPAPDLGEHTESVLRDLGFDTAGIEELRKAEAVV
ncbi:MULTISPECIES: CaiB/BaiF CoA transferase family protein [Streptomyces]|uniref:CaiB/BaiF CoA transferase family protein n=1 Tax=Streptomyces TaxID=1883 RepID=UPI001163AE49|nr:MULTISPECIES: CoA transferase [Streptomyces]MCX4615285.1 CoA transferase [Streptomyces mirabilis]MCX5356613.1 CoA transferase [Streptomyces mirabilis]QDN54742.1 CoA transferase [Streptomyces sp. S1D4-20]QDN64924.1 CoA transferase [Streptomyces sp. S1D4-14]QDN75240.1 CoA transferase [Streptomyces sp. S1A1-7]